MHQLVDLHKKCNGPNRNAILLACGAASCPGSWDPPEEGNEHANGLSEVRSAANEGAGQNEEDEEGPDELEGQEPGPG
jgi:hypothetical protein